MSNTVLFIHGMFQNAKSWDNWIKLFRDYKFDCIAKSWPLHEGEPADLRANPPLGLGDLHLDAVVNHYASLINSLNEKPFLVGHSVGGLIVQKLIAEKLGTAGVAIASVAPNRMLAFDWSFFKNAFLITNPFLGNQIFEMTPEAFHQSFANTLSEDESRMAYEATATHDSRNMLRDCMSESGHIDLALQHSPLLFLSAEKDEIIPPELCEKNAKAYEDTTSIRRYYMFPDRSHYICGEPGWDVVATYVANWLAQYR